MTNSNNKNIKTDNPDIDSELPQEDTISGYFNTIQNNLKELPQDLNKVADVYLKDVFCIISEIVKEAVKDKDLKNLGILADVAMNDIQEKLLNKVPFAVQGDPLMEEMFRMDDVYYDPFCEEEVCDTEYKRMWRRWYYSQDYSNVDYREEVERQNSGLQHELLDGLKLYNQFSFYDLFNNALMQIFTLVSKDI